MIQIANIRKSYEELQVLRGIDLTINDGEIATIVGPSGAGKTTLLQIIGTLDKPDSGSVSYDGVEVASLSDKRMARFRNDSIGFVFQFHQLLPELTLEENVALPALIGNASMKEATDRARRMIEYLGLSQRRSHRPSELSGGERQRAAVARALVNSPRVVLADEPSGSLDSANRAELHQLFLNLRRDFGQTFVIVTHDAELAALGDRTIEMRDGLISGITINNPTDCSL